MFSSQFVVSAVLAGIIFLGIQLVVAYLIMLERKVASWIQDRTGPNRTGISFGQENLFNSVGLGGVGRFHFWGLGQPLADGLKFLFKEDYTPPFVDRVLFMLAPVIAFTTAMIAWAVIPWGGYMTAWDGEVVSVAVANVNIGVIYILAVGSLAVYGVVLAGYASNSKYSFYGGVRATAQMLSYEIPLGLVVLIVILMVGSARADDIVHYQANAPWLVLYQPILAMVFFVAMLAECNRAPFDLAESEQELVGGYHTEYSSMKFAMFFLAEYVYMVTASAFFVLLFFGGWDNPFYTEALVGSIWLVLAKMLVFSLKVLAVLFVIMWIRWTLPRFRFDQLMKLAWQGLIPLCIIMLLITGVMIYLRPADATAAWSWNFTLANLIVIIIAPFAWKLLPKGLPVNRRVRLVGSRFYGPETT